MIARRARLGRMGHTLTPRALKSMGKHGRVQNVQSCVGADGYHYHSRAEARVAAELELRVKAKDIRGFDRQVWLRLMVNGVKVCSYVADFDIQHNDGSREILEVKGWQSPEWRIKRKLFEATWLKEHPGVKFTVRPA